ncbi:MAG TPA: bifunctional phosphopantothenoylcysteine decarboxylase/phosphopantothenate--cysteine ligase CoaBC [Acidobacteriota bacterium]|nr:bifunctional phosphopantothenoylcysteine decarboxylase/phosphopantothenate--cysteine ligase CoaBC [Acidobacteriota bacterium]
MSAESKAPQPHVVLVVSGGIAAYKACDIVRRFRDLSVDVHVAMTRAATQFVTPTTFAALSGNRVVASLFEDLGSEVIPHVRWAERAALVCVAPATANFIAKMAHGIADDFPSTLLLAASGPVLVAPAMEDDMYRQPAVQRNLELLSERGVQVVGPGCGALASGRHGPGRMSEPGEIITAAAPLLGEGAVTRPLHGANVFVTAGPTREMLDPVRVFTNRSSGKMGYALAAEAAVLGARVRLISGPTCLPDPPGVVVERVENAAQMAAAVFAAVDDCDIGIMAAAVCDFTVATPAAGKIKKAGEDSLQLEMTRTTDILAELGTRTTRPLLVGFAAETGDLETQAREKLERKGCDLIVGNLVDASGRGMGGDDNEVIILDRGGGRTCVGPALKHEVARAVWEAVLAYRTEVSS